MTERWPARRALAILAPVFVVFCYATGTAPTFYLPNEALVVQQTLAIYHDRTPAIDGRIEPYLWGADDTVFAGGKRFPNKSPGGTLAMLAAAPLVDALVPGPLLFRALAYGGRVLALTLPFMLFLYWLGRRLEEWSPPPVAWGVVLAYALGTNASVYATLFFTHNLAAICLGAAFFAAARAVPAAGAAGLWCGAAMLFENSVFLAVPGVLALAAFGGGGLKACARFAAGLVPAFAIQMTYQYACFGDAFATPLGLYHAQRFGERFLALGAPDPRAILGLLFSPSRGALFQSPWMFAAFAGIAFLGAMPREKRRIWIGALALPLAQTVFIACYKHWDGGWGIGARYVTAFLPLWAFAAAASIGAARGRARAALAVFAAGAGAAAIAEHAFFLASVPYHPKASPSLLTNFLTDFAWPYLREGYAAFTAAGLLGVPVAWALAGFAALWAAGPAVYVFFVARGRVRAALWAAAWAAATFAAIAGIRSGETVFEGTMKEAVLLRNHYEQRRVAEHAFRRAWLGEDDLGAGKSPGAAEPAI